ncbi:CRP-like cAMP-binding protein [Kibdelosporangium banguiense]|uniref:CRP-like cAMP-binding protein n=1 Tax=Kibdelosporangium banguiense TaxID=1365924 RepID=A0ABS4TM62_9PSEU|nr:Crp/Fnr family transcriptional regulator [Kibdelosporangium banguiense]MBP2325055.1 CRP-like cAMP-binding protein [Kibdelosporangium banguiense]
MRSGPQRLLLSDLLSSQQWASLVRTGVRRTFPPGSELVRQGDSGTHLFAIVQGRVRITYDTPDGTSVLMAIRGAGDLVGEFASRDGRPRSASVVALDPCHAYRLRPEQMRAVAEEQRMGDALEQYMTGKFRQQCEYNAALFHLRGATRLALLLVWIVDAAGPLHPDPFSVRVTQSVVAEMLGWSLASVKNALAELRSQDLVRSEYGRFVVTDLAGLRRLVPASEHW